MSQVSTAEPVASPAPAPPPAPAAAPSSQTGSTYNPSTHMVVERERFRDDGYDYHKTLTNAERGRSLADYSEMIEEFRKAGKTPAEMKELLRYYLAPSDPGDGRSAPVAPPLDMDALVDKVTAKSQAAFNVALEERDKKLADAKTQGEYKTAVITAQKAEDEFGCKTLADLGYPMLKDGRPDPVAQGFFHVWRDKLNEALAKHAPAGISEQQWQHYCRFPTPEVLAEAAANMGFLKNLRYSMASQAAREQEQIGATLGAGPGGKQGPPRIDPLKDPKGFQQAVMEDPELQGQLRDMARERG